MGSESPSQHHAHISRHPQPLDLELDLIQRVVPRSMSRENTIFVVLMDRGPGWDRIIVHDTLGNWVTTIDPSRIGEISSAIRRELAFHLRNLRDERRRELGVEM